MSGQRRTRSSVSPLGTAFEGWEAHYPVGNCRNKAAEAPARSHEVFDDSRVVEGPPIGRCVADPDDSVWDLGQLPGILGVGRSWDDGVRHFSVCPQRSSLRQDQWGSASRRRARPVQTERLPAAMMGPRRWCRRTLSLSPPSMPERLGCRSSATLEGQLGGDRRVARQRPGFFRPYMSIARARVGGRAPPGPVARRSS